MGGQPAPPLTRRITRQLGRLLRRQHRAPIAEYGGATHSQRQPGRRLSGDGIGTASSAHSSTTPLGMTEVATPTPPDARTPPYHGDGPVRDGAWWRNRAGHLRLRRHIPAGRTFGQILAAYGYLPDRYDITGALICLVGMAMIMYALRGR